MFPSLVVSVYLFMHNQIFNGWWRETLVRSYNIHAKFKWRQFFLLALLVNLIDKIFSTDWRGRNDNIIQNLNNNLLSVVALGFPTIPRRVHLLPVLCPLCTTTLQSSADLWSPRYLRTRSIERSIIQGQQQISCKCVTFAAVLPINWQIHSYLGCDFISLKWFTTLDSRSHPLRKESANFGTPVIWQGTPLKSARNHQWKFPGLRIDPNVHQISQPPLNHHTSQCLSKCVYHSF